jgi:uncharacterized protein YndB with AHSA1/START domain
MRIVSTVVARPIEACWRVFTDPSTMGDWVPGLHAVTIVRSRPDGLPQEARFEYAADLTYSLIYTYDLDASVVRWEPLEAQRGGVRGFARFTAVEGGTEMTYALEHDGGRKAAERSLDDPKMLIEAFARRMHGD